MAMELKGKVIQLLQMQTGMGKKGQWKKQEFIVETQSQYPKKVCLSVWGDKIDQFRITEGDQVNVSVELESREYNGRWYTEARAWKVEKAGGAMSGGGGKNQGPSDFGDEPFQQSSASSTDDLPF
ncbi:MAG TPA: DUF3127 domain-containing protein [Cyclobacteriaceae bacterium]|nr:DUF3127 domain-containing protein [Cyclobacteriaceae bacterium]